MDCYNHCMPHLDKQSSDLVPFSQLFASSKPYQSFKVWPKFPLVQKPVPQNYSPEWGLRCQENNLSASTVIHLFMKWYITKMNLCIYFLKLNHTLKLDQMNYIKSLNDCARR